MSAKKTNQSAHEPSWTEVILGAVLSVALGGLLGVVLLAIKPLAAVKELPKEPVAGMIYYIQGSRDSARAKDAPAKRKLFAQGGSVTVSEDEINSFLPAPPPLWTSTTKAKPGAPAKVAEKAKAPENAKAGDKAGAPAASGEMIALGGPNFHLHDGKVQIAVPVTISVFGLDQAVTVVADGIFVKKGSGFAFDPETVYLGSCPVQSVPFAMGFVSKKFISALPVPEDIAAAWPKVASAAVEGNALKLMMP